MGEDSRGINVNLQNASNKNSALHHCAERGSHEVAQMLLEFKDKDSKQGGADINLKNEHEETALHFACEMGFFKFVSLLLSYDNDDGDKKNNNNSNRVIVDINAQ